MRLASSPRCALHRWVGDTAQIGHITADPQHFVEMRTIFGGRRMVDWLHGEQLPRIPEERGTGQKGHGARDDLLESGARGEGARGAEGSGESKVSL